MKLYTFLKFAKMKKYNSLFHYDLTLIIIFRSTVLPGNVY